MLQEQCREIGVTVPYGTVKEIGAFHQLWAIFHKFSPFQDFPILSLQQDLHVLLELPWPSDTLSFRYVQIDNLREVDAFVGFLTGEDCSRVIMLNRQQ
jgi:hypothetical protein